MRLPLGRTVLRRILREYVEPQARKHTAPEAGPWRVLFFGNDDFSLETLKKLHGKIVGQWTICQWLFQGVQPAIQLHTMQRSISFLGASGLWRIRSQDSTSVWLSPLDI